MRGFHPYASECAMPYSDPEIRRAYHRQYMAERRAKQPKPEPKPRKNASTLTEEELRARQLAYVRAYQAKHPERVQATREKSNAKRKAEGYFQKWAKDNPDKEKAKHARYRAKDPERAREKVRKWRTANVDARRKADADAKRIVRAADPEGVRTYQRAWKAKNPERISDYNGDRYSKAPRGRLSRGLRALLMSEQGGRCPYCLSDLATVGATLDHYVSLKRGGQHIDSNMQLTCRPCNQRKSAKDPSKFLLELLT